MAKQTTSHTVRNIFLAIVVLLLVSLGVFFIIDYSHYAKDKSPYRTFIIPRLEVSLFQITALSADKADMVGTMMIHNPLPFNLRADSLEYKIFIGGVEVIKSTYPKSLNIKRWDTTLVELSVTAYNDKLLTVLKQAEDEGKDSVVYEVQTSFGTQLIVHKDFNLDIQKLLPLVYIPKVEMSEIVYDSLNVKGVDLYLHARITNKNKFPLKFKNLKFKFALADNDWLLGQIDGVIDIKDTSVTPLVLPLHISFKDIGKSIGPLIAHGKNTPYKFQAMLELVSDNNALKNSKVVLANAGAIKEITKLVKDEKKKQKEKEKSGQVVKEKKTKHKLKIGKKKH